MDLGKYSRYAVVTLCSLLLFFLGFSFLFQRDITESIVSLLVVVLLTVAMSYGNRTPLGGFILGLFTSTSFLLGFLVALCTWELSVATAVEREYSLAYLMNVLSFYGPGMLSAVLALAFVGLFFGLLGYVFGHISMRVSVKQPHIFRDYWSNVHLLGKSDRREYSQLDRKLSSWSVGKRGWWGRLVERITEPQPDLVFALHSNKGTTGTGRGNLFDLSAGRMIGSDLIDPSYLISKYRPLVLKVAETSSSPKGVRRLASENLVARFLGWLIPSRAIWLFYLSLSAILVSSVYLFWTSNLAVYPYYQGVDVQVVLSALICSSGTLFFVWRWRRTSRELFMKRPDERVLIFAVYIILALLYGLWFAVIVRPPGLPEDWAESWPLWIVVFLALTFTLGFGYLCIHRESEVVNTYFYDNSSPASGVARVSPFREPHDEPFWLAKDGVKAFWVLRFMYFWRYEVAKTPHSDWERVEVWVDAEKGTAKWVVSDYHYRELWYKVRGIISKLYINFFINFHTPVPVVDEAKAESISSLFSQTTGALIRMAATGEKPEIIKQLLAQLDTLPKLWKDLHSADWIRGYGLPNVAANFCSKLPWTYWRYPHGLEKAETYLEQPAAKPEDQPLLER